MDQFITFIGAHPWLVGAFLLLLILEQFWPFWNHFGPIWAQNAIKSAQREPQESQESTERAPKIDFAPKMRSKWSLLEPTWSPKARFERQQVSFER